MPEADVVTTLGLALLGFGGILKAEAGPFCGKDAIFLERLQRRKNGKGHTCWALVESIRTAKGWRQRVVAYLGELTKRERNGWVQLGRRLNGQGRP